MSPNPKTWLRAALIALAGCWVFSPVLHGPWLWDDDLYITQNPLLRSAAGLGKIWLAPTGVNYFPITFTVQWIQWHLWGDNPAGYHATNIVLHLLSALLLWRVLFKLGVPQAWLGGLIFAIHPLTVESVAWISELKNTLSLPFLLLAFSAWVDAENSKFEIRNSKYFLSLLCFLAAMLCKSTVVMFPFVLLLYAWWKRGKLGPSDLKRTAPFFAVSLVLGVVTIWFEHHRAMGGLETAAPGGLFSRVANAGLAVVFYFFKCVVPCHLSLIYPPWTPDPLWRAQLFAWLAIAAIICALVRWSGLPPTRPAARHLLFGLGFFLINLVPVLGIVPMAYAHISWVADHFAYLPLVGLSGLGAAGASKIFQVSGFKFQAFGSVVIAALLAALAVASHRDAVLFGNGEALWDNTVQRSPESPVAHNNYGLVLAKDGQLQEAIAQYEEALRLKPDFGEVDVNLGLALASSGQRMEAIARYRDALRLNPAQPEAHTNLCIVLRQTGQFREAVAEGEEALRLRPDYPEADNNLAVALIQERRNTEAMSYLERALQLQPGYAEARSNLGLALLLAKRVPEAIAQEEEAVRLDPGFAHGHYSLGLVLSVAGRPEDATAQFEQAIKLEPGLVEAHLSLGRILFQVGRIKEGQAQMNEVVRLQAAARGQ